MELLRSFLRNTRKPEGFLGKCMVASMNYAMPPWRTGDWAIYRKQVPSGLRNWAAARPKHPGPSAKIPCRNCHRPGLFRNIRGKGQKYQSGRTAGWPLPCHTRGCVAPSLRMGVWIWRLPLKRYIFGPAPRRVSGRCTAPCGRAASF